VSEHFEVGDWVVYAKAEDVGKHPAYRVAGIQLEDGVWRWRTAISVWRDCAPYRVAAIDFAKPAPEPTLEKQLREAGATHVKIDCHPCETNFRYCYVGTDDKVDVTIESLTPARAVAALRAATGLPTSNESTLADLCHTASYQLAAEDAEIARLRGETEHLKLDVKKWRDKLHLADIYIAEAVYHVKAIEWLHHQDDNGVQGVFCPECGESRDDGHRNTCKMGAWLARNRSSCE
jgi:hypothetical protein